MMLWNVDERDDGSAVLCHCTRQLTQWQWRSWRWPNWSEGGTIPFSHYLLSQPKLSMPRYHIRSPKMIFLELDTLRVSLALDAVFDPNALGKPIFFVDSGLACHFTHNLISERRIQRVMLPSILLIQTRENSSFQMLNSFVSVIQWNLDRPLWEQANLYNYNFLT